jgi:hypothetical protein
MVVSRHGRLASIGTAVGWRTSPLPSLGHGGPLTCGCRGCCGGCGLCRVMGEGRQQAWGVWELSNKLLMGWDVSDQCITRAQHISKEYPNSRWFIFLQIRCGYVSTVYPYRICTNTGYGPILAYRSNVAYHHKISWCKPWVCVLLG